MTSATTRHSATWLTMAVLAILVSLYAAAALFIPQTRPAFIQNLFDLRPMAIAAHLSGGILALLLGAFQVSAQFRNKHIDAHRLMGKIYIAGVIVGGLGGLALAVRSIGGLVGHVGFGMMAVLWIATAVNALRHILQGNVMAHRAWMLRSYALTLAAVTLRIYLPLSQVAGISFDEAYPAIAWLCWVPNLLFVEWVILARPAATSH